MTYAGEDYLGVVGALDVAVHPAGAVGMAADTPAVNNDDAPFPVIEYGPVDGEVLVVKPGKRIQLLLNTVGPAQIIDPANVYLGKVLPNGSFAKFQTIRAGEIGTIAQQLVSTQRIYTESEFRIHPGERLSMRINDGGIAVDHDEATNQVKIPFSRYNVTPDQMAASRRVWGGAVSK